MSRLKGVTIVLFDKIQTHLDPFGQPQYELSEIEVHNVLIAPTNTEDIREIQNLTGKKAVYTLAIPKSDTNDWVNKEVFFFNKKWRTVGIPIEGIPDMIPLQWNRKVMVEYVE